MLDEGATHVARWPRSLTVCVFVASLGCARDDATPQRGSEAAASSDAASGSSEATTGDSDATDAQTTAVDESGAALPTTSTGDGPSDGEDTSTGGPPEIGPVIWLLDGESGALQSVDQAHDGGRRAGCMSSSPSALGVHPDESAYGEHSLRIHLQNSWTCNKWGVGIAQDGVGNLDEDVPYWLGWAMRLSPNWDNGKTWTVLSWHPLPGVSQPLRIQIHADGNWRVSVNADLGDHIALGPATPGQWREFVAHFVLSRQPDLGSLEIWARARGEDTWTQVADFSGVTVTAAAQFPFRVDLSLGGGNTWNGPTTDATVFFDEVRLADGGVGFDTVVPASGAAPTPSQPVTKSGRLRSIF